MASLSLREAPERTGTSKVDIWCAIRAGRLPAKTTDDGGFAIDRAELFAAARSTSHGTGHNSLAGRFGAA
jgi:hypothetical protein